MVNLWKYKIGTLVLPARERDIFGSTGGGSAKEQTPTNLALLRPSRRIRRPAPPPPPAVAVAAEWLE